MEASKSNIVLTVPRKLVDRVAAEVGLDVVGVSQLPIDLTADARVMEAWLGAGYGAGMEYLRRSRKHCDDPGPLFQGLRTIISCGLRYNSAPHPSLLPGYGRIARYAWGRDYHVVLQQRLRLMVDAMARTLGGPLECRIGVDALHLLERAVGARAGLGFIGKNTLLIRPRVGSYFVLGEILLQASITESSLPVVATPSRCGPCERCLGGCPTQAFVGPNVLDARRCISFLTIEKGGALSYEERGMIGPWLFGCDECQDVCPFNHRALHGVAGAGDQEFQPINGVGPLLKLADVLNIPSNSQFERRFAGTALLRARRPQFLRNALIVAVNTGCGGPLLEAIAARARTDSSSLVRRFALWAYWQVEQREGSTVPRRIALRDQLLGDADDGVREEAQMLGGE